MKLVQRFGRVLKRWVWHLVGWIGPFRLIRSDPAGEAGYDYVWTGGDGAAWITLGRFSLHIISRRNGQEWLVNIYPMGREDEVELAGFGVDEESLVDEPGTNHPTDNE